MEIDDKIRIKTDGKDLCAFSKLNKKKIEN